MHKYIGKSVAVLFCGWQEEVHETKEESSRSTKLYGCRLVMMNLKVLKTAWDVIKNYHPVGINDSV